MFKQKIFTSTMIAAAALLWGCMNGIDQNPGGIQVNDKALAVSIVLPESEIDSISRAEVTISGDDMDTLRADLSIDKNKVSGIVNNIPLGNSRHIEIHIYNNNGYVSYYGDAHTDIISEKEIYVTIKIRCLKGSVIINGIIENEYDCSLFAIDTSTVFLADFNNNINDLITGNPGSLTSAVFAPSLYCNGIKFSNLNSGKPIYRFPATSSLTLTTGTMEAVIFTDGISSDYMHIIDKSWLYGITAYNGKLAANFGSGWWYTTIAIPVNKWTYVCASFDGSTIRLYLNGECVASNSNYPGFNGDSSYDLGIGNGAADTHNVPFIGTIDEIRISKSVRTASEIAVTWASIEKKVEGQ